MARRPDRMGSKHQQDEPLRRLDVETPGDGEIVRIAEDLHWFRFRLPFRLNHINLFAIDTREGWLLVDCGINTASIREQWDVILPKLTARKSIAGIIVSHHHADHIGHAGALAARMGTPLHIGQDAHNTAQWALGLSAREYGELAASVYANFGLPAKDIERTRQAGNYYRELVEDYQVPHLIEPGQVFSSVAGSWRTRFDWGHAPGHLGLVDDSRKLYIAFDFLLGRISPNISAVLRDIDVDVLGRYYEYLGGLDWLDGDWSVICGHDWHHSDGARRARQLVAHHDRRLEMLADVGKPQSTADAMATLFPMELTDHELLFASGEARAHLNALVARGALLRRMEDGTAMFEPA